MIKNILLDLDDTLLDFSMAERIALTRTLLHYGIDPAQETIARYHTINEAQWRLLEQGVLTGNEVKYRRFKLFLEEIGAALDPAEISAWYERMLGIGHYFVPGAEAMLEKLSTDYRLYLVSNGFVHIQNPRIESAHIAHYFNHIFISQEVGYDKPNPRFFNICFSKIPDFRREETLIVGDSLTSDISGGKNAGIRTVWFNPRGKHNGGPTRPDHEIGTLDELSELLKKIS